MNSPDAFKAERTLWRTVIYLNITHCIRIIINAMDTAQQISSSPTLPAEFLDENLSNLMPTFDELPTLTPELLKLKMRLSPLLQVEESVGCNSCVCLKSKNPFYRTFCLPDEEFLLRL